MRLIVIQLASVYSCALSLEPIHFARLMCQTGGIERLCWTHHSLPSKAPSQVAVFLPPIRSFLLARVQHPARCRFSYASIR